MKKLIYIMLASTLLFLSCEDVVDVDVPEGEPRLTVDASFEIYLNESPVTIEGYLRLTLSAPFFDDTIPPVTDATVFITNLEDNSVINFEASDDNPGFYDPVADAVVNPEFNTQYELTVIYDNETYKAKTELFASVPINSVEQGDGTLFEGDETEIIVSFADDGTRNDFYLFDFDFNLLEVSEDRFYQGEAFNFSYFYENMFSGQEVTIKILGIGERYFNYAGLLIEQSRQGDAGPFQTPPALLRGNIINTTNPDNYALGYFNLSEANRIQFTIEE
ncbi:DUF4249 domain-containing protein [uncultured Winogradskyella sp.]|uniref:DUF4249 domain-containing protein n=1 Tax=uncultured Winogradskyella sp. TaxID=395353 RepID=UPI0026319E4B|nr:DUF4249 domain-containing protein [uncultured Winogradskyella sp.]